MNEYVGIAMNHDLAIDPQTGKSKAMLELVILSSVARWIRDVDGFHPVRELAEYRVMVSPNGLCQMADLLRAQAAVLDGMNEIAKDITFSVKQPEEGNESWRRSRMFSKQPEGQSLKSC